MIEGPTPFHLFEKPTPGTGATLLVDVLVSVFTGRPLAAMTAAGDDEEMRKRMTSKLLQSPTHVVFDNIATILEGAALSSVLTATKWEDRILGLSRQVSVPVRCAFAGTGNNPMVSNEIARRTVRCRLDAGVPDPHLRPSEAFRHPDLRAYARLGRVRLVEAALTLGRAWVAAGRPYGGRRLGMFEAWSEVTGGVLEVAGVDGFLDNLVLPHEASHDGAAWSAFVQAWWRTHRDREVLVAELLTLAEDSSVDLGTGADKNRGMRLGRRLGRAEDTLAGGLRVKRGGTRDGRQRWALEEAG